MTSPIPGFADWTVEYLIRAFSVIVHTYIVAGSGVVRVYDTRPRMATLCNLPMAQSHT
jgi:hypothetical protein